MSRTTDTIGNSNAAANKHVGIKTLTALGVVYGDIGTSPLYALRECFHGPTALELTFANVMGVRPFANSLVAGHRDIDQVLRDSHASRQQGRGWHSLAVPDHNRPNGRGVLILMGLFGAGLLLGDGIITPAISVLSAVEGLHGVTSAFDAYVVPITIGILFGLFAIQHRGTAGIGSLFGPVMLVWFATLALLGFMAILNQPQVIAAISPHYAAIFFANNQWAGFIILGLVFLVVTGGEALYADMGHFGTRPIRLAWFGLVLPALLINYFGQGALLLDNPADCVSPFYRLAPDWAQYPLVGLATAATVIASQAVISGAFSLWQQAVLLGYSPWLNIVHTSSEERGQIYIPALNWALFTSVVVLVFSFKSSSNLAAAYGTAVTSTMVITTIFLYVVARELWGWSRLAAVPLMCFFLVIDLAFFSANLTKFFAGGWLPILIGIVTGVLMTTWRRGRQILSRRMAAKMIPTEDLLQQIEAEPPIRVSGSAIYLTGHSSGVPFALLENLRKNKTLHEIAGILTIVTENAPYVRSERRVEVEPLGQGLHRITARYGFMQHPSMSRILTQCEKQGVPFPRETTTFFLGRETLEVGSRRNMARWRKILFVWMSRNAHDASQHFGIPPDNVVEIGVQLDPKFDFRS